MNIIRTLSFAFLLSAAVNANARIPAKVESFSVRDVRLTESPFKHAEDMDIRYLLGIDPDRLLAPFMKEAGLEPKAQNYTNWENTGLDGHIGGHYLSALSYMYAATGHEEIGTRLEYFLSELKRCADADPDGYICGVPGGRATWKEISEGNIREASFDLNGKWVPLYNIHKIYAGLRDAFLLTGNTDAREMFIRLTEWMYNLTDSLSDEDMQRMLESEHGGLNEVFADAAAISGDERYLRLARRFSHNRILEPLLKGEDRLTGLHANTQIPKVIGYKRIADLEGNAEWDKAAGFFWETVVRNRSISIGGNSVREHFHPADDFSTMLSSEQGPETCNTYNMLRLTKMLFETSGSSDYMDYYERALYNHILSTVNPVQGGFVYFTPMRSGHYRVYSQPQTSFWCCVGSGMENHARYGEMIYSHNADEVLYVNLFIPSVLQWGKTRIEQKNSFPAEEGTTLLVDPKKESEFTIKVRIPEWTDRNAVGLEINGEKEGFDIEDDGYLSVTRRWKKGDRIHLDLPMSLRLSRLPDNSSYYSFMYGPIVLAAETGRQAQLGMYADDSRGGHIASGEMISLDKMPVIVGDKDNILSNITPSADNPLSFTLTGLSDGEEMTLVPFYTLHECRYMVYWQVASEEEWAQTQRMMAEAEAARAAMEAATLDKVTCGEQQPESDHFVEMVRSRNGNFNGRQWRVASGEGWFSYQLKTDGDHPAAVMVEYTPSEHGDAVIFIDGTQAGRLSPQTAETSVTARFEIPDNAAGKTTLTIRIAPASGRTTPFIHEVRLLR